MEKLAVLILAAGLGKRMGQNAPKVLAAARAKPLLEYVLSYASTLSPERMVVITGHGREAVEQLTRRWCEAHGSSQPIFAVQAQQLGTGDAVKSAIPALSSFSGTVLILYGDVPLVRADTLRALLELHDRERATISLISFEQSSLNAYGRVIRDRASQFVKKIVEAKDCSEQELKISELNSGIYAVESAFLVPAIEKLTNKNAQSEYYLTDIVQQASSEGQTVVALKLANQDELLGVNTLAELKYIESILMRREIKVLIDSGVIVEDPQSLFIDSTVQIAPGVTIGPNVQLRGDTKIESGAKLEGSCLLIDTLVGKDSNIRFGVRAEGAVIGSACNVGPFANLRQGSTLKDEVKVGNFVETKNTTLEKAAKASHLTYLGDAQVGENANIGAGTITCNYDGVKKHKTSIGKGAFIGSNSALVAPVTIGEGAYVGAGSVITKNVPEESLAVTRAALQIKDGWAKKRRKS